MIEVEAIKKYYGKHLVLDIPQYKFDNGIYWLKGENGSGKTTLMKLIAGLIPFEGDVVINEKISIRKNRIDYLRKVNYTEAEPLYPSFVTGDELIQLFIKSKGGDFADTKNLMRQLKVETYAHQPIGTYSSGMNKKLSLILAFIGKPDLILLDEPLVTIDTASVETVYSIIHEYAHERKVNFIITSHHDFDSGKISFTKAVTVHDKTIHAS